MRKKIVSTLMGFGFVLVTSTSFGATVAYDTWANSWQTGSFPTSSGSQVLAPGASVTFNNTLTVVDGNGYPVSTSAGAPWTTGFESLLDNAWQVTVTNNFGSNRTLYYSFQSGTKYEYQVNTTLGITYRRDRTMWVTTPTPLK